jgi:hypothetical protein
LVHHWHDSCGRVDYDFKIAFKPKREIKRFSKPKLFSKKGQFAKSFEHKILYLKSIFPKSYLNKKDYANHQAQGGLYPLYFNR